MDCCDAVLRRLAQGLADMAAELWPFIQEEHAMVRQRHVPGIGTRLPPTEPTPQIMCCRARNGRVVMNAVRAPGRPAPEWMRVGPMVSARGVSGRMVAKWLPNIDVSALEASRRPPLTIILITLGSHFDQKAKPAREIRAGKHGEHNGTGVAQEVSDGCSWDGCAALPHVLAGILL